MLGHGCQTDAAVIVSALEVRENTGTGARSAEFASVRRLDQHTNRSPSSAHRCRREAPRRRLSSSGSGRLRRNLRLQGALPVAGSHGGAPAGLGHSALQRSVEISRSG